MMHLDHIKAYYLNKAMSIPGGASNSDYWLVVEYWRLMARYNNLDYLSR